MIWNLPLNNPVRDNRNKTGYRVIIKLPSFVWLRVFIIHFKYPQEIPLRRCFISGFLIMCVCMCVCSVVSNSATVAQQAPLSIKFFRQEYWSGLPFPPGDLPEPGIEPTSPALARRFHTKPPGKPPDNIRTAKIPGRSPSLLLRVKVLM